jgi:hypothetical protein
MAFIKEVDRFRLPLKFKNSSEKEIVTLKQLRSNPSQQSIQIDGTTYTRDEMKQMLGKSSLEQYIEELEEHLESVEAFLDNLKKEPQEYDNLSNLVTLFQKGQITPQEFLSRQSAPEFKKALDALNFYQMYHNLPGF